MAGCDTVLTYDDIVSLRNGKPLARWAHFRILLVGICLLFYSNISADGVYWFLSIFTTTGYLFNLFKSLQIIRLRIWPVLFKIVKFWEGEACRYLKPLLQYKTNTNSRVPRYDALVLYAEEDVDWVLDMVAVLEGQGISVCLLQRDVVGKREVST